jgi:hypothetical protein
MFGSLPAGKIEQPVVTDECNDECNIVETNLLLQILRNDGVIG